MAEAIIFTVIVIFSMGFSALSVSVENKKAYADKEEEAPIAKVNFNWVKQLKK